MPAHRIVALLLTLAIVSGVGPAARAGAFADEPSPEYRASLRRTLELRKQRRAARVARPPVGKIVPFPMPPSLIIRHTPEVHGEIGGTFRRLR
jgi:hypothetical protein